MPKPKLKACPFCGGTNIGIDVYDEWHTVFERRHGHCYNCGTLGPTIYRDKCRSDADNIRKAVAAWNRRAEKEETK